MTKRIDHVVESMDCATAAYRAFQQEQAGESSYAMLQMMEAQVQATLALARQQQIANLIALATEDLTMLGREAREALGERDAGDPSHSTIAPDIAAALGIERTK